LDLNLKDKLINFYIRSIACYGAENWTLRKVDQKYLDRFETWCWRMMEKISWTDRVRDKEVLHTVKEGMNILYAIKRMNANRIGHILCRNWLVKHVRRKEREEYKLREDEEEDVNNLWMTLRKRRNSENCKRKH
jgi:hypothetical protein